MAFNYVWEELACHDTSQQWGALWKYGETCVIVTGKKVEILPDRNSLMEGFQITNFNFHTNSSQVAVSSPAMLPWIEAPGKLGPPRDPMPPPTPGPDPGSIPYNPLV